MSDITIFILEEAADMIKGHLFDYQKDIDRAYLSCDNTLTVSLSAKFSPKGSGVKVDTNINFTPEKIKDKASRVIDSSKPKQKDGELPFTFANGKSSEEYNRYREILFRNFDDLRKALAKLRWMQKAHKDAAYKKLFKKF
jgi:hypothetical protein